MPLKEKEITKMYYSISEVSKMFDVRQSTLRYWEKEFDILQPKKNKKGTRYFTQADIDNLKIIFHLVKERGFTIQGAKDKIKGNKEDTINTVEIMGSLKRVKDFLLEIKSEL